MAENTPVFMSQSQFADAVGVSKMAITKAIDAGKIAAALKPRGRRYQLHYRVGRWEYLGEGEPPTDAELAEIAAPWPEESAAGIGAKKSQKTGPSIPPAVGGRDSGRSNIATGAYSTARAMQAQYAARITKIKYEEMVGNLIPADAVRVERFKQGRVVRDAIMNIPNRIGDALASALGITVDSNQVSIIMETELRNVLQEIANANNSTTKPTDTPEASAMP